MNSTPIEAIIEPAWLVRFIELNRYEMHKAMARADATVEAVWTNVDTMNEMCGNPFGITQADMDQAVEDYREIERRVEGKPRDK